MPSSSRALTSSAIFSMMLLGLSLVGQLGDDDLGAALGVLHDLGLGPHLDGAPAGAVGVHDARPAEDQGPGREVRALDEVHQVVGGGVGVVDQVEGGVDDLAQVVRAGCWSPCPPRCPGCR